MNLKEIGQNPFRKDSTRLLIDGLTRERQQSTIGNTVVAQIDMCSKGATILSERRTPVRLNT